MQKDFSFSCRDGCDILKVLGTKNLIISFWSFVNWICFFFISRPYSVLVYQVIFLVFDFCTAMFMLQDAVKDIE